MAYYWRSDGKVQFSDEMTAWMQALRAELESLYNALTVSCAAQETNWHDPQYDLLHERVELYAGEARAQLLALNDAVQYISVLAAKLRAL